MNDEEKTPMTDEEIEDSIKKISSKYENIRLVKPEDSINFKCKRCGKCCMNRDDIVMNPYDIYNIAVAEGIDTHDAITKYTTMNIGGNSSIPIIRLKEDERHMCPFLKFYASEGLFGCSINNSKPGNCALHPVGVVRNLELDTMEAKDEMKFLLVDYCDYSKEANQQTKISDITKGYMENSESHDLGSKLQFEFIKYVNVEKFFKAIIGNNEEFINKHANDSERIIIKELHDKHKDMIQMLESSFCASYINGTYKADTSRSFIEQKEEILSSIKNDAITIIVALAALGLDVVNPNVLKLQPEIEDLISNRTSQIKEGFEAWLQEQHQQ